MAEERAGTQREERADNDNRARKTAAPERRPVTSEQEQPSLRQRWNTGRASKTAIFWLLAAAIVLTMIIGFTWGGWVTGGSAQATAGTTAQSAVIERLAPICVAQFNQDPDRDAKLVELQDANSYQRGAYIRAQGWATMPGEEAPDSKVADACARLIIGN